MTTNRRLLLISNSTAYGSGYLDHCIDTIEAFLAGIDRLVFISYALTDSEGYTARARARLKEVGVEVTGVHETGDHRGVVAGAEALFIGGGNTFRLLERMYAYGLLEPIRERVADGMPYMGASAGTNVACPTIRTTNDMPIVEPPSLDALGLVDFQINPHYLDAPPDATHQGETREQRLFEYLEANPRPVVAIREGSYLRVDGPAVELGGPHHARLFRRGHEPIEAPPGSRLDDLLASG
jgi:dipeptidase E